MPVCKVRRAGVGPPGLQGEAVLLCVGNDGVALCG
jgi:hypothetical protein